LNLKIAEKIIGVKVFLWLTRPSKEEDDAGIETKTDIRGTFRIEILRAGYIMSGG
jgi:hypothetical protein